MTKRDALRALPTALRTVFGGRRVERRHRAGASHGRRLGAGTVSINTYGHGLDVRLPWGGLGSRASAASTANPAIENFTEPKAVWLALDQ